MEEQCLRCNSRLENGNLCRKELKDIAVVTTCSHVLCKQCAERTGFTGTNSQHRRCPVCTQPLPNIDDAAETNLRPSEEYKMSVLCGFDPTTIMECASGALSFWNYQMLQETAYQHHMLLALSKKYSHLNQGVNHMVEEANGEIQGLSKRIGDMSNDYAILQRKNVELADNCRERGKKYTDLRKGYEVLKKIVQQNQQNPITEKSAEQAVRSFAANPGPETIHGALPDKPENREVFMNFSNQPDQVLDTNRGGIEQLHRHQHTGSGSQYSGGNSRMPPPQRPYVSTGISPIKTQGQHRTPLPGATRLPKDRFEPVSTHRYVPTGPFLAPGSGHRHSLRVSGVSNAQSSRQHTAHGYGISSGMKVGGASAGSDMKYQTGYVSPRTLIHRRNDSTQSAGSYL